MADETTNPFQTIRGVGPALAEKLAGAFKSVDEIRGLTAEELAEKTGMKVGRARQIVEALAVETKADEPLVNELDIDVLPDGSAQATMGQADQAGNVVGPVIVLESPPSALKWDRPIGKPEVVVLTRDVPPVPFTPSIPEFTLPVPAGSLNREERMAMVSRGARGKHGVLYTARCCGDCGAIVFHDNPDKGRKREPGEKPTDRPGGVSTYAICTCGGGERKGTRSPCDGWGNAGLREKMVDNPLNAPIFAMFANYAKS